MPSSIEGATRLTRRECAYVKAPAAHAIPAPARAAGVIGRSRPIFEHQNDVPAKRVAVTALDILLPTFERIALKERTMFNASRIAVADATMLCLTSPPTRIALP